MEERVISIGTHESIHGMGGYTIQTIEVYTETNKLILLHSEFKELKIGDTLKITVEKKDD